MVLLTRVLSERSFAASRRRLFPQAHRAETWRSRRGGCPRDLQREQLHFHGSENWIELWLHNDFGWFNRIADALRVVPVGLERDYRLFGYRIHPEVFTTAGRVPFVRPDDVRPEPIGHEFLTLGFDVASRTPGVGVLGFECSPLSCNMMAAEIRANEFCLLTHLDDANAVAERFAAEQPEPGDYHVIEVLEQRDQMNAAR